MFGPVLGRVEGSFWNGLSWLGSRGHRRSGSPPPLPARAGRLGLLVGCLVAVVGRLGLGSAVFGCFGPLLAVLGRVWLCVGQCWPFCGSGLDHARLTRQSNAMVLATHAVFVCGCVTEQVGAAARVPAPSANPHPVQISAEFGQKHPFL